MTTLGRLMPDRIPAMARMMEQQIREGGFKKHHEIFLLTLRIPDLDALFDSMDGQVVQVILEGMSAAGKGSDAS